MITYHQYASDIAAPAVRIYINDCGLLEFKNIDYHLFRPAWNTDYQLLYVARGTGHFYHNGKHLIAPAGSAVLYAPGDTQEYRYFENEGALVWFCHFKGAGADALLQDCPIPTCVPLQLKEQQEIYTRFSGVVVTDADTIRATGAGVSLLWLLQHISQSAGQSKLNKFSPLAPVLADMRQYYMCERTIEQYAAMCHLSKYHFLRLFKAQTGVTPIVYRNEHRLLVAEQLLLHSNLTLEAVAEMVGFSSAAYFCRVYKQSRGHSCRQKK